MSRIKLVIVGLVLMYLSRWVYFNISDAHLKFIFAFSSGGLTSIVISVMRRFLDEIGELD